MDRVRLLLCCIDRGAVREQRMRRVAEVFQIKLPVRLVRMFERPAGNFDLTVGRAIDHVVE